MTSSANPSSSVGPHVQVPSWVGFRWAGATALGHLLGALFWAMPAAWLIQGPGEAAGPASSAIMFALTAAAAICQGTVLGLSQGMVLRAATTMRPRRWALATCAGVLIGWGVFIVGAPTIDRAQESAALGLATAVGGLAFGAAVGGAQWAQLRRVITRGDDPQSAILWVGTSAIGWSLATVVTVGIMQHADPGSALNPWAEVITVGLVAALGSGVVLGALTGLGALRVLR